MSLASFPSKAPSVRRSLPSTGSLRTGSPVSTVLFSAPNSCHPSPQASSPSPSDTTSVPASFVPTMEQTLSTVGRGVVIRVPLPGMFSAEMTGPPRFLGDPLVCMPCSQTPVESWHLCRLMPGCCLPLVERRRLPQLVFGAQSHGLPTPCVRFAA